MSSPETRIPKRKPQGQPKRRGRKRGRPRLRRSLIILVIVLVAASIGAAIGATIWLGGSRRACEVGTNQVRVNVQPTRLLELPDYALETEITITNSSPCELHVVVIKTTIVAATLTDGANYTIGVQDSQSVDLIIKSGGQDEVVYLFPQIDRRPTSLWVQMTLGFEGQADIPVFEGQIVVP
jgi:hypothetical protein